MKAAFLTTIICLSCASSAKAQDYAYSYDFYQADSITVEDFIVKEKLKKKHKDWYMLVYKPFYRMRKFDRMQINSLTKINKDLLTQQQALVTMLSETKSKLKDQMTADEIQKKYDIDQQKHQREKKAFSFLLRSDRYVFEEYNPDDFVDIDEDIIKDRKESIEIVKQLDKIIYDINMRKNYVDEIAADAGVKPKKSQYKEEIEGLLYSAETIIDHLKDSPAFFSQEQKNYVNNLITDYNKFCDLIK